MQKKLLCYILVLKLYPFLKRNTRISRIFETTLFISVLQKIEKKNTASCKGTLLIERNGSRGTHSDAFRVKHDEVPAKNLEKKLLWSRGKWHIWVPWAKVIGFWGETGGGDREHGVALRGIVSVARRKALPSGENSKYCLWNSESRCLFRRNIILD